MKLISRIPAWLKNKYILTTLVFVVWILFFDDQDIFTTYFKHRSELHKLEESRDYYLDQINLTKSELEQLKSDKSTLEKFAREKYWMKKDNEDLFILPE
ncbi:FtsB family cell division protein [Pseudoflavitalea rhizosphaerae]|uniref:FtsB family cell division protein n=1 Tax=Pseudoflavitalea rhizosphaerae TaxID=1884793 RepID=UPI000F8E2C34|nr:septum formation initiator family protein [Pseudoflavitalea rhizosphaerae]